MAKAVYICPDTRALAVRDRALVVGTVKSDPGCICGVTGCCGGGAEPCTLPAEDGAAPPLVVSGGSTITTEFEASNLQPPTILTHSFTGGSAPQSAVACSRVGTVATTGDPLTCAGSDSVLESTPYNSVAGYHGTKNVNVYSMRMGSTGGDACGAPNNTWDISFSQSFLIERDILVPSRCGFVILVTLDVSMTITSSPNMRPCITYKSARVVQQFTLGQGPGPIDNPYQPCSNLLGIPPQQTIDLTNVQFSIVQAGGCAASARALGSISFFLNPSQLSARHTVTFDLTFADGSTGCSKEVFPTACLGACCTNGVCSQKSLIDCEAGGGAFYGQGVPCAPLICAPAGPIPNCCDTSCCRVTSLAPGGNLLINWTLRMESQGRACCTNFNPAQVRQCLPATTNNSGVATTPYTSDCMTFTEGQVQGQKTLSAILAVNPACCPGTTVNNIFINPNQVGFIASCNATSGPLFTFVIRLSNPGGAVVSFVSQSCNSISFDETVSVFQQSCGAGTLFWLADIRMIGSATISSRHSCASPALGNRPDDDFIARPSIENSRDVLFHGSNVPLRKLARGGCGTCGGKSTGGLKGLSK